MVKDAYRERFSSHGQSNELKIFRENRVCLSNSNSETSKISSFPKCVFKKSKTNEFFRATPVKRMRTQKIHSSRKYEEIRKIKVLLLRKHNKISSRLKISTEFESFHVACLRARMWCVCAQELLSRQRLDLHRLMDWNRFLGLTCVVLRFGFESASWLLGAFWTRFGSTWLFLSGHPVTNSHFQTPNLRTTQVSPRNRFQSSDGADRASVVESSSWA